MLIDVGVVAGTNDDRCLAFLQDSRADDAHAGLEQIAVVDRRVVVAVVEPDGLTFLIESVLADAIRNRQEYGGVRVRLVARLGTARVPLQVDVGFGVAVTPAP